MASFTVEKAIYKSQWRPWYLPSSFNTVSIIIKAKSPQASSPYPEHRSKSPSQTPFPVLSTSSLYSSPYAQVKIIVFDTIQLSSIAVVSAQRSSTISRDMANHNLSSSDASPSIRHRHGSSPKSYGFGSLINFATGRYWNCCRCRNVVNATFCSQVCGICGHGKCASCGPQYTN